MNNLHISLTEFRNESRVLKETESLINGKIFSQIYIASLWCDDLPEHEIIQENITLNRFKLITRKYSKSFLIQILKYIEFCYSILRFYRKKNIQVVNIHTLSLLPLGVILKYTYRVKLVYDAHELETETNGLRGARKSIAKKLEQLFIRSVDLTIVVSEPIADWYQHTYNIDRPIVLLNAPKLINEPQKNDYFREKFNIPSDKLLILYQGGLAKGRGIELLLEAFKSRKSNDSVIIFLGYGELEAQIKISQQANSNIFFHPSVSPQTLLQYTVSADIGVHLIENTCLCHYYCLPNKLFEYAMVGLPVIVSNMQEMRRFVNQYELGIVVNEQTPEAFNQAINNLITMDFSQLKYNARQAAIKYSWEVQEEKMFVAYHKLLTENT